MTEWRTLDWLPGYAIAEDGRVKWILQAHSRVAGRELVGALCRKGYHLFTLRVGGKTIGRAAHRLVCEAWHGPPPFEGAQVAHWDGCKLNNHYSNLRWTSAADNTADKLRHGTWPSGENGPRAVLSWADVREIRRLAASHRTKDLAARFGVASCTISHVVKYRNWREEPNPSGPPSPTEAA